jgi:hypothetical protein
MNMIDLIKSSEKNLFTFRQLFTSYIKNSYKYPESRKWRELVRLFLTEDNQKKIVDLSDGISEVLLGELHLWCKDAIDRVYLSSLALKVGESRYATILLEEAITLVEDYEDGYAVLKANEDHKLLSENTLNDLFEATLRYANSQEEYLNLLAIGEFLQTQDENLENCLKKALNFEITFEGSLLLGEYYSAFDHQKSWDWYIKSIQFLVCSGTEGDIFYSLGGSSLPKIKINKLVGFVLCIDDDTENRFNTLKYYEECIDEIDETFDTYLNSLLQDCIEKEEWCLIDDCIDDFNMSIPGNLKDLLESDNAKEPQSFYDMFSYANLMMRVCKNKGKTKYWFLKAIDHADECDVSQIRGQFDGLLRIAEPMWELVRDDDLFHEILWKAYKHPDRLIKNREKEIYAYRVKEILTLINRTSQCAIELKRYFDLLLSEKHISSTYSFATRMASDNCQHWRVVDDLFTKARNTAESYDDAVEIYKLCSYVDNSYDDFFKKYSKIAVHLMDYNVKTTQNALNLAHELSDWKSYKERVDPLLGKALELAKEPKDYRDVSRFYNLILHDSAKALKYLNIGLDAAQTADDFEMFSQEAKLILGRDWQTAF